MYYSIFESHRLLVAIKTCPLLINRLISIQETFSLVIGLVFFDPASHENFMWDSNYDQCLSRHPGSSFFILGGSRPLTLN